MSSTNLSPMPAQPHHIHGVQSQPPKPNQQVLSLILRALVMTFITSLFFLFLGVAAILLLCLAGGAIHRRRRRRTQFPSSSDGLSSEDLLKLPQFRYARRIERGGGHNDCAVCLDEYREGQWCRKLVACNHVFHRRCLDTWLIKVPSCPICRTPVRLNPAGKDSLLGLDEEAKRC